MTDRTTSRKIILEAGDARLSISTDEGGRFSSLVVGGQELLVTDGPDAIRWGCYPMVPYAGRIGHGRFTFRGREVAMPVNLPPHAIHGTVFDRAWAVSGPDTISVDLGPDWPFAGRVTQRVSLTADGLEATLTLEADETMPASMGWHPWFRRRLTGTADRPAPASAEAELGFDPGTMLVRGPDGLPSGRTSAPTSRPWDDCFTDVRSAPTIAWPGLLRIAIDSNASYWVVFDEPVDAICVEPQSAPPDFANLAAAAGREPDVVEPGHPMTVVMRWRWDRR